MKRTLAIVFSFLLAWAHFMPAHGTMARVNPEACSCCPIPAPSCCCAAPAVPGPPAPAVPFSATSEHLLLTPAPGALVWTLPAPPAFEFSSPAPASFPARAPLFARDCAWLL